MEKYRDRSSRSWDRRRLQMVGLRGLYHEKRYQAEQIDNCPRCPWIHAEDSVVRASNHHCWNWTLVKWVSKSANLTIHTIYSSQQSRPFRSQAGSYWCTPWPLWTVSFAFEPTSVPSNFVRRGPNMQIYQYPQKVFHDLTSPKGDIEGCQSMFSLKSVARKSSRTRQQHRDRTPQYHSRFNMSF